MVAWSINGILSDWSFIAARWIKITGTCLWSSDGKGVPIGGMQFNGVERRTGDGVFRRAGTYRIDAHGTQHIRALICPQSSLPINPSVHFIKRMHDLIHIFVFCRLHSDNHKISEMMTRLVAMCMLSYHPRNIGLIATTRFIRRKIIGRELRHVECICCVDLVECLRIKNEYCHALASV